jgi:hypothetical protein
MSHPAIRIFSMVACAISVGCGDNLAPIPSCRATAGYEIDPTHVAALSSYDEVISGDGPVAFWAMRDPYGIEPDLSGNGNDGSYEGARPLFTAMPNGDPATDFNGAEYLSIPSNASLSIPTTGSLTWEAWMKPDALELDYADGYVNWLGKCADYAPTCEWEARFFDSAGVQARRDRFSAYVFDPSAGSGAGADWQSGSDVLRECEWHHVVGEYTLLAQPADCPSAPSYPGSIDIWVDGVEWNQASHSPTGCMSQFDVAPVANDSPLDIGASAPDTLFDGAIGKVAIYPYVLDRDQIAAHYQAMMGAAPSGSCADVCTAP